MKRMVASLILTCFVFISITTLACANENALKAPPVTGKEADRVIQAAMVKRWERRKWQIEYTEIEGLKPESAWHVRGTGWWVRLDPSWVMTLNPEFKFPMLEELDQKSIYEFTATAVDQSYGVITFYVTSRLMRVDEATQSVK